MSRSSTPPHYIGVMFFPHSLPALFLALCFFATLPRAVGNHIPCEAGEVCVSCTGNENLTLGAGRRGCATTLTCSSCSPGRFAESAGYCGSCDACSAGRYNPASGSNSSAACLPCAAGKFGATAGLPAATCTGDCSAGYYCSPGSSSATEAPCAAGRWSRAGSPSCTDCAAGTWSSAVSSSCTNCAAGKFNPNPRSTSIDACASCGPGQFSGSGAPSCSDCQTGRYNPNSTQSSCSLCASVRFLCAFLTLESTHSKPSPPPSPASAGEVFGLHRSNQRGPVPRLPQGA